MAIFKGPTRAVDQLLVGPSIPNLGDTGWVVRATSFTGVTNVASPTAAVRHILLSKRLGGIIGCKDKTPSWHLNGFVDGSNIGSTL